MIITPYKLLSVKKVFDDIDVFSIPVLDEEDIDTFISVFIVNLVNDSERYNNLMDMLSDEKKDWFNEPMSEQIKVLTDFFNLIPSELKVLIKKLNSVRELQQNLVMQMTLNQQELLSEESQSQLQTREEQK